MNPVIFAIIIAFISLNQSPAVACADNERDEWAEALASGTQVEMELVKPSAEAERFMAQAHPTLTLTNIIGLFRGQGAGAWLIHRYADGKYDKPSQNLYFFEIATLRRWDSIKYAHFAWHNGVIVDIDANSTPPVVKWATQYPSIAEFAQVQSLSLMTRILPTAR